MQGAEYLVQIVITDYESNTDGGVGGPLMSKVPILGGAEVGKSTGRVGLNIRSIDAETCEITCTKQIESALNESNIGGAGFGNGGDAIPGGSTTSIREIEVTQVQEKFSIARPVSLSKTPDRGDVVMATTVTAPPEFALDWKNPK